MTRASDFYNRIKADPVKYEAYLARKRAEDGARRQARPGYDAKRKKRWRERNPERAKLMRSVNQAVHKAVKSGKLVRPGNCSECGKKCTPEAHHAKGYRKEFWLVVEWLCRKCHMGVHHADL